MKDGWMSRPKIAGGVPGKGKPPGPQARRAAFLLWCQGEVRLPAATAAATPVAATATAAAATTRAATAAKAATPARRLGPSLVYVDCASVYPGSVQLGNRRLGIPLFSHFSE